MAYKKTNEAWFGDSFNRDSITAACSCDLANNVDSLTELVGYVTDAGVTYGTASNAIAISSNGDLTCKGAISTCDYAINCATDGLTTKLEKIQAQIDDLKQNYVPKKGTDKLRLALKTLNYTREI
jgi:LPS O-antigen subunit length determinant protein (WzzB/FepE family)